jgi:hypothetical protein
MVYIGCCTVSYVYKSPIKPSAEIILTLFSRTVSFAAAKPQPHMSVLPKTIPQRGNLVSLKGQSRTKLHRMQNVTDYKNSLKIAVTSRIVLHRMVQDRIPRKILLAIFFILLCFHRSVKNKGVCHVVKCEKYQPCFVRSKRSPK